MTTTSEALAKFLLIKEASLRADTTLRWYGSVVSACLDEIGHDCDVTSITEDDMLLYIKSLRDRTQRYEDEKQKPIQNGGLSMDSIRSHITGLRGFWSWCSRRYDMKNPMQDVSLPKKRHREIKAVSPEDFVKLFEATARGKCPQRDCALLAILADTGARRAGILNMTVTDVLGNDRRCQVIEKGNKKRWIYWTHFTQQMLTAWVNVRDAGNKALWVSLNTSEPLTGSAINQMLKRLKQRTNVRGRVNPHGFRHHFARHYLQSGGDLVTLARLLGHEDVNVTAQYYAVFSSDELADMQRKHSPLIDIFKDKDKKL